jgi:hypothetical protein
VLLLIAVGWKIFDVQLFNHEAGPRDILGSTEATASATVPAINGVLVDKAVAEYRPISLVIENYPDSRPQSGLADADIVYEILAEGGVTRFLAIYQTKKPEDAGPVRSARDYLGELANEIGAVFGHVGGSPEALSNLARGTYPNVHDLNEYSNGDYFYRKPGRSAPHNVYTTAKKLDAFISAKQVNKTTTYVPWQFSTTSPTAGGIPATTINVDFSTPEYAVRYTYDSASQTYKRELAGKAHVDANAQTQLAPATVVIQYVNVSDVPKDPKLRVNIDLASGGKAAIFSQGRVIEGTWKKENNHTQFMDAQGNDIAFMPGQIWFELVPNPPRGTVTWSAAAQ